MEAEMKQGYIVLRGTPSDPANRDGWRPARSHGHGLDIQPASAGDAVNFQAGIEVLDEAELQDAYDDPSVLNVAPTDGPLRLIEPLATDAPQPGFAANADAPPWGLEAVGALSSMWTGVDILSAQRGDGLTTMSGTSMATPHVAGVAALWAQQLKSETGQLVFRDLMLKLLNSVLPLEDGRTHPGYGLVRAPQ
jgi:subtilisin family serine protease